MANNKKSQTKDLTGGGKAGQVQQPKSLLDKVLLRQSPPKKRKIVLGIALLVLVLLLGAGFYFIFLNKEEEPVSAPKPEISEGTRELLKANQNNPASTDNSKKATADTLKEVEQKFKNPAERTRSNYMTAAAAAKALGEEAKFNEYVEQVKILAMSDPAVPEPKDVYINIMIDQLNNTKVL